MYSIIVDNFMLYSLRIITRLDDWLVHSPLIVDLVADSTVGAHCLTKDVACSSLETVSKAKANFWSNSANSEFTLEDGSSALFRILLFIVLSAY